jgi:hypothetical protein
VYWLPLGSWDAFHPRVALAPPAEVRRLLWSWVGSVNRWVDNHRRACRSGSVCERVWPARKIARLLDPLYVSISSLHPFPSLHPSASIPFFLLSPSVSRSLSPPLPFLSSSFHFAPSCPSRSVSRFWDLSNSRFRSLLAVSSPHLLVSPYSPSTQTSYSPELCTSPHRDFPSLIPSVVRLCPQNLAGASIKLDLN